MKRLTTTIFMLFFLATLHAQDTLKLSLQQAIQYGLANNKTIKASELEATLTRYKTKEYQSALYPVVNGNAGISHFVNIPVQYAPANTFDPTAPSGTYTGLKLQLPNVSNVGLSANWLLYDQAIYSVLKLSKAASGLTDIQIQKDKSDLAYYISQLYYGVIYARKRQENLVKVDVNMAKLVEILQAQFDNGVIKRSDLDKVKVNKASTDSRIDQLNAVIATQVNILKLIIGLNESTPIKLTEPDIEQLLTPVIEPSDAGNNFDVRLLKQQIVLSKLEHKTIIADYYPSLSANYGYSYNWVSPDLNKVIGSGLRFPQQFIGLNLSVPIFTGYKTLYRARQNAIATRQLELKADFLQEQTTTAITNAQLTYNTSLKNLDANSANVKLGQKIYEENLYEYQQGTVSLNDVLTTENALEQALSEYFNSVSNAFTALLDYKKAANTILTTK